MIKRLFLFPIIILFISCATQHNNQNSEIADIFNFISNGNINEVEKWITKNDINTSDQRGGNLLYNAIENDQIDIALLLIRHGADLYQMTTKYAVDHPPLFAVKSVEMAKALIKVGVDLNCRNSINSNVLQSLLINQEFTLVEFFLQSGVDPNIIDNHGWSHLMLVNTLTKDNSYGTALLIKYGADPSITEKNGKSPLIIAANHGDINSIELLLNAGADINIQDTEYGWTCFLKACNFGHIELAKYLWENEANIYLEHFEMGNALEIAKAKEYKEILSFLSEIGF